jgi:hypothetical protein
MQEVIAGTLEIGEFVNYFMYGLSNRGSRYGKAYVSRKSKNYVWVRTPTKIIRFDKNDKLYKDL